LHRQLIEVWAENLPLKQLDASRWST